MAGLADRPKTDTHRDARALDEERLRTLETRAAWLSQTVSTAVRDGGAWLGVMQTKDGPVDVYVTTEVPEACARPRGVEEVGP